MKTHSILTPSRLGQRFASFARALPAVLALAALAVPNQSSAQVQLPSGPPYLPVSASSLSGSVAIGDMNGDGNKDVVLCLYSGTSNSVQVVLGDGQGGFAAPRTFTTGPVANPGNVVLGDLNGDGKLDVVVVNHGDGYGATISVLFGDGAGNLSSPVIYDLWVDRTIRSTPIYSIALGDVDGDGKLDIVATTNMNQPHNYNSDTAQVVVLRNNGSGVFTIPTAPVWTAKEYRAEAMAADVAVGDLDGDGKLDIVVTSAFGDFNGDDTRPVVTILYGDGTGAFPTTVGRRFPRNGPGSPYASAYLATGLAIADIDGDGKADVVVVAADNGQDWWANAGAVTVFRNTGARTFDMGSHYGSPPRSAGVAIGDLNSDGHPDIVVTGAPSGGDVYYLLNDGSGAFGPGNSLPLPGAFGIATGDLTNSGPGTVDIVAGTLSPKGTVLLKNGPAGPVGPPPDTTPPVITAPVSITKEAAGLSGAVVTFTATATDNVDGPVTVIATPPSGSTFPITTTIVGLAASDKAGNTASASFKVTVQDTTPPTITSISGNLMIEATSTAGAVVTYAAATATDLVTASPTITYSKASGSTFAFGATTVNVTAADAAGNKSYGSFTVTVRDTTAPAITSVTPSTATLWPPLHQMVAVSVAAVATDAVGVASLKIVSVTSSEPDNGLGDGDTPNDIQNIVGLTVNLRAERSGTGSGRTYTITVEARDAAGNASRKSCTVFVPQSQGGK